jgi:pyruvate dehydrogenase E1 component alpha subunit
MPDATGLGKEKLAEIYRRMLKIRRFEETLSKLWAEGFIPGLIHLYIGEEAVAVGACANLQKEDYITSTHRGHGHCIAKGGDIKRMMAELFGKKTGYCKGKGGSMHICVPEIGVVGCSGIAGGGIPIATGVGLSIQIRKTDQVCVCFFGDGSSNTGAFHEGINLAALWKLPVIFLCENNLYAISVPVSKSVPTKNVADRAAAYGISGIVVDGMDVIAVYEAVHGAVERARRGGGPTLIECKTYRFRGHFEGDPKRGAIYRSEEEIQAWEKRDPIKNLREKLLREKILTEKEINAIEKLVEEKVEEAVNFAKESPLPSPGEATEDLFVSL